MRLMIFKMLHIYHPHCWWKEREYSFLVCSDSSDCQIVWSRDFPPVYQQTRLIRSPDEVSRHLSLFVGTHRVNLHCTLTPTLLWHFPSPSPFLPFLQLHIFLSPKVDSIFFFSSFISFFPPLSRHVFGRS